MALTPLPTPPSKADPNNFSSRADTFLGALPTFQTELNALIPGIENASTQATNAANSASAALTSRNQALTFRNEAEMFKNQAEAAVTSLPDGSINDALISLTNAYSAVKIENLFSNLNASNLVTGTIPAARFPATLPALSGANLNSLNASELDTGTVPGARLPNPLPAISGSLLTNLNASNLTTGTVPAARLPGSLLTATSGAAPYYGARAFLRFDGTTASPVIFKSANVASVTKNATGDYTITFSTALPDYVATPTTDSATEILGSSFPVRFYVVSQSATSYRFSVVNAETDNEIDLNRITVVFFG